MKQIRLWLLFALVAVVICAAQTQPSTTAAPDTVPAATAPPATASPAPAPPANPQPAVPIVNPEAQSESIRILTPVSGQTLPSNFVNLRFELVRPALSGDPNYLIQLDGADPIDTTSTDYTFSGLQPGLHSVRVTLVDANKSPVQGGAATVQFKVPSARPPARSDGSRGALRPSQMIAGAPPAAPIPSELRDGDINLPLAGSPLPILSLIGFGLLIGGAAQTMRAR
jgi:hypothetical protein